MLDTLQNSTPKKMNAVDVLKKNQKKTKKKCYGQHQLWQRIKHESAICRVHPLDIVMKHTVSLQPWFTRKFTQVLSFAETCARSMFETYIPSCHQTRQLEITTREVSSWGNHLMMYSNVGFSLWSVHACVYIHGGFVKEV